MSNISKKHRAYHEMQEHLVGTFDLGCDKCWKSLKEYRREAKRDGQPSILLEVIEWFQYGHPYDKRNHG